VKSAVLILASASPRRQQLLDLLGLEFETVPAAVEERPEADERPTDFACRVARDKALEVAAVHPSRLVLGADTVVELDGSILGKPTSEDDASSMLRRLSGRGHLVHTAMALSHDGATHVVVDTAAVTFAVLTEPTIRWYVATGEPMDKAGAYAVQGAGGLLVEQVSGSPQTVIGLPIHRLPELFSRHGLDLWSYLGATGGR
jgi:septum formation protein